MTRLADIQDAFQSYLLTGDPAIQTHVIGTPRVPLETRLGIYGNGYRSRLIESLGKTFPVLASLLGEVDFEVLGAKYVSEHASTFPSIRYYGDELAGFLATDADYSAAPILAELARWEWAMAAVFDAADAKPIDVSELTRLAPEQWAAVTFDWSPCVQVLDLEWNVPQLWKTVTEDLDRPDPSLSAQAVSWLIWRSELQIYFRPLAAAESVVIAAGLTGRSFGELCVLLCEHLEEQEASVHAAAYLRDWVESGLIVRVRVPP